MDKELLHRIKHIATAVSHINKAVDELYAELESRYGEVPNNTVRVRDLVDDDNLFLK